jgi:hypothetical protein
MNAALAVLTVLLAGCGSVGSAARPLAGNMSLDEAHSFDEFPLYYAGDEIDGLPLVAIVRRSDTADYVSFVYGDCEPPTADGGCTPPAEIQIWPATARDAGSYDASHPGTPALERTTVRGRSAAFVDEGTRLEIYADRSTVVIFSRARERVLAVAATLRCLDSVVTAPGGTLAC